MPITLAHPALVLPLAGRLPLAALVVGSMVPDVPVFIPGWGLYDVSHSLRGLVLVDLPLALLVLVVWHGVVRDALVDLAPAPVRNRHATRVRPTRREWLLSVPAAVIGAASHIVWDAFTHQNRWGVRAFELLQETQGPLPGFKWAQYLSGVLGMGVVLAAAVQHVVRQPTLRDQSRPAALGPWAIPAVLLMSGALGLAAAAGASDGGLRFMAAAGVIDFVLTVVAGVLVLSLLWQWRSAAPRLR